MLHAPSVSAQFNVDNTGLTKKKNTVEQAKSELTTKQLATVDALMIAIKKWRTDEQQKALLKKIMPLIASFKNRLPDWAKKNLAIVLDMRIQQAYKMFNSEKIINGDRISVWYTGMTDGSVFDTNVKEIALDAWLYNEKRAYSTLSFVVGQGMMIPGFEKWVLWMHLWEVKTMRIPASEAYGEWTQERVQDIPLANFEQAWMQPVIGESFNFWIAQWTVLSINGDMVTLDFNHFLAGKELVFDVEVVEIGK